MRNSTLGMLLRYFAGISFLALPTTACAQGVETPILVTQSQSMDSVHVEIGLDRCTKRVRFTQAIPLGRRAMWRSEGQWRWISDYEAISEHCRTSFAFTTSTAEAGGDREYPFVIRSAAGTHLYLPYLQILGESDTSRAAALRSTECSDPISRALTGYALTNSCRLDGRHSYIDSSTPDWLARILEVGFESTLTRAQELFGDINAPAVRMYVRYSPSDAAPSWRGWTSEAELFVNFSGNWNDTDELRYHAEKYLTHEVLHLWNGWVRSSGDQTPAWLTEGYAEFFALELMRERGSITGDRLQRDLLERAEHCLSRLAKLDSLEAAEPRLKGKSIYDCGVMAVYQLDRKLDSRSLREAALPWKRLFNRHTTADISLNEVLEEYSFPKFHRANGSEAKLPSFDPPRFSLEDLEQVGILARRDSSSGSYLTAAREEFLQSLAQQFCESPPYGFTTFEAYAELDTEGRCGILTGSPKISGVASHSLFVGNIMPALTSAMEACKAGRAFQLNLYDGADIPVRCKSPMSLPAPRLSLACPLGANCDLRARIGHE